MSEAAVKQLIDGPGRYPRRDGGFALIVGPDRQCGYDWKGFKEEALDEGCYGWSANGRFLLDQESSRDIIGPRLPDEPSPVVQAFGELSAENQDQASRIASLEAENARLDGALQTELAITQHLQQALATYRDKPLWKLIVTAYGNAPFGAAHDKIVADAKAMQRAVEGGAA